MNLVSWFNITAAAAFPIRFAATTIKLQNFCDLKLVRRQRNVPRNLRIFVRHRIAWIAFFVENKLDHSIVFGVPLAISHTQFIFNTLRFTILSIVCGIFRVCMRTIFTVSFPFDDYFFFSINRFTFTESKIDRNGMGKKVWSPQIKGESKSPTQLACDSYVWHAFRCACRIHNGNRGEHCAHGSLNAPILLLLLWIRSIVLTTGRKNHVRKLISYLFFFFPHERSQKTTA